MYGQDLRRTVDALICTMAGAVGGRPKTEFGRILDAEA